MQSAVLAMIDSVLPSVRPSDHASATHWYNAKTTSATIVRSSLQDSPMTHITGTLLGTGKTAAEWGFAVTANHMQCLRCVIQTTFGGFSSTPG